MVQVWGAHRWLDESYAAWSWKAWTSVDERTCWRCIDALRTFWPKRWSQVLHGYICSRHLCQHFSTNHYGVRQRMWCRQGTERWLRVARRRFLIRGIGAPKECPPGRKAAHAKRRPSRCRLLGNTRKRPPHKVATCSRRRGSQLTNCRHHKQRATSLAAGLQAGSSAPCCLEAPLAESCSRPKVQAGVDCWTCRHGRCLHRQMKNPGPRRDTWCHGCTSPWHLQE